MNELEEKLMELQKEAILKMYEDVEDYRMSIYDKEWIMLGWGFVEKKHPSTHITPPASWLRIRSNPFRDNYQ